MRLKFATAVMFVVSLVGVSAEAGQFNPTLNIGDKAPEWKDLPGVDGKTHSLAELSDKTAVVLVFTCNSCDVATDYEDRIIELAKKYAGPEGKAAVVAVNVNKIPEDSLEKMKERAAAKKFPFTYLFDETQKIAKDYGATFTPEFFVLDRERKIAYMGGMDDHSSAAQVTKNYLSPALDAILAGSAPETKETSAIGCMIRYARERRR
jgi:peroxiredoxin